MSPVAFGTGFPPAAGAPGFLFSRVVKKLARTLSELAADAESMDTCYIGSGTSVNGAHTTVNISP